MTKVEIAIPAQSGHGFVLQQSEKLKIIDPRGGQVCDLYCVMKADPADTLSSGRSIDYCETLLFSKGHILYSQKGIPMLAIVEDTCGRHDFLITPCSLQMFQMISRRSNYHPSCEENLKLAFRSLGQNLHTLGTTFNAFMNVEFQASGAIKVCAPLSKAGDFIVFEAMADLLVGLTACADENSNGGSCKPIKFEIVR